MLKPAYINPIDWQLLTTKYALKYLEEKLKEKYPIQYLIGNVNFYGYEILVDERVFIPRPETEWLVDKTIKLINKMNLISSSIVDICSGSGCIAIAVSNELNQTVTAIEKNSKSIELAEESTKNNNAKVKYLETDIMTTKKLDYDIIISNPPYLDKNTKVDIETKYEPQTALFPEHTDATIFYKHIIDIAKKDVKIIAFEVGKTQSQEISDYAKEKYPNYKITVSKDLAGKNRYIFITFE